jgi:glycerol-3-phosphate dehydrogenase subunit C
MLEGDRQLTLEFVRHNIDSLAAAVATGYDIVYSCPTCGFMLRNLYSSGKQINGQNQGAQP